MTEVLLLIGSALLIAACGVFVAAEFSLLTVDRASVEDAARGGDRKATQVLAALTSLSTQLSGAQLGITVTNLAIGFLAEPAIANLIEGPLEAIGIPSAAVTGVAVTIGLLFATAATMVFGELVPKNLAIAEPWRTARGVAGIQQAFTAATSLIIKGLNGTANAVVRALGMEPVEELASARSPVELTALVRRSAQQGSLEQATATLVERSLAFGDRLARDVLTPRVRVRSIGADAVIDDVIALTRTTGHSRFPVVGLGGLDDVVGVVHIKHAVAIQPKDRARIRVRDVMVDPVLVPETVELDPLLQTLRGGGLQLAIVIDEYGGAAGIVTIEDLIEEIVGEVTDEHDRPAPRTQQLADGSWIVSALLRPDEVTALTGLGVPDDDDYETVAGLVAEILGRIPAIGDVATVGGIAIEVVRMDGRRVDRLRLAPSGYAEGESDEPVGAST